MRAKDFSKHKRYLQVEFNMVRLISLLLVLFCKDGSFLNTNIISTESKLSEYETNLNSSISLEKEDADLRSFWMIDSQVKRINITTKYRMEMIRHKEHSFQRSDNIQWSECLHLHRRHIRKSIKEYYANESECLTTITFEDRDRTKAVEKVEKEIRKWRRRYRRLVKSCKADYPVHVEVFSACLVEYVEKDKVNQDIQRLIVVKLEAMGQLFLQLKSSLSDLEECLQTQLSTFLDRVRFIMDDLTKCYVIKTKS